MKKDEMIFKKFDNRLRNANGDLNTILGIAREVRENGTPEISERVYNSIIDILRRKSFSK